MPLPGGSGPVVLACELRLMPGLRLVCAIPYRLAYLMLSLVVKWCVSGRSRLTTLRGLFLTELTNVLLKFLSAKELVILNGLLAVTHCLTLALEHL